MPGKPLKAPIGNLTPRDVAKRAKLMGFNINPRTLSQRAHKGKIPFTEPIPGEQKGVMFPESKLIQVIAAVPKKVGIPKDMFTAEDVYRIAKEKDLPVKQWNIFEKVKRVEAGKEPIPGAFSQDMHHQRHRYLFSKEFVDSFLRDARHRKNLPKYLKKGHLIPIKKFAGDLGLKPEALYRYKNLKTFPVKRNHYLTRREAQRFKKWYEEKTARKLTVGEKRKKPMLAPMKSKGKILTVGGLGWKWFEKNKHGVRPGRRDFLERIIQRCENLPAYELFDKNSKQTNWEAVLELLEEILYR